MVLQHIWLALGWILFCALHSLLATSRVKAWWANKFVKSFRFYRLWYTLFATVTLALVIFYQWQIDSPRLYTPNLFIQFASGVLLIAGLVIMFICIRKYFMNLSGVKSLIHDERSGNELRIDGIHQHVRHPLYSGTFLAIWGAAGLLPYLSFFIACFIITFYTTYAIRWEEEKLVKEFGQDYKLYKQKVPMLWPFFRRDKSSKTAF